jgi:hypothetical protein
MSTRKKTALAGEEPRLSDLTRAHDVLQLRTDDLARALIVVQEDGGINLHGDVEQHLRFLLPTAFSVLQQH